MNILVVDDDVGVRETLAKQLRRMGHEVTLAETGEQAMDRMRERKPGLVLLDLTLGAASHLSGWDVGRQTMSDPDLRDVPIVVVTGLEPEEARKAARGGPIGADGMDNALARTLMILQKPIENRMLARVIRAFGAP